MTSIGRHVEELTFSGKGCDFLLCKVIFPYKVTEQKQWINEFG